MKNFFTPIPAYFWKKLAVFFSTHLATLLLSCRPKKILLFVCVDILKIMESEERNQSPWRSPASCALPQWENREPAFSQNLPRLIFAIDLWNVKKYGDFWAGKPNQIQDQILVPQEEGPIEKSTKFSDKSVLTLTDLEQPFQEWSKSMSCFG